MSCALFSAFVFSCLSFSCFSVVPSVCLLALLFSVGVFVVLPVFICRCFCFSVCFSVSRFVSFNLLGLAVCLSACCIRCCSIVSIRDPVLRRAMQPI